MGYEIDFLGTSSDSKSGDAIAVRFGDLYGSREQQTVIVIDGGFIDDGQKIVEHIKTHFNTSQVDLVISTHPDQDHINGLQTVLTELEVLELWMHQPWEHNEGLANQFHDGRITDNSIGDKLKDNLNKAYELYKLADALGIAIYEPFTGLTFTDINSATENVKVLGPTAEYYESLIPDFDGMPDKKEASFSGAVLKGLLEAVKRFFATWGEDQIEDDVITSAKNSSSVITQIIVDDKRLVFTADAGVDALHYAANQLDLCLNPAPLSFIQIPHHGSRRNVGPTVLNRIIGEPVDEGEKCGVLAIASTAKNAEPKHPRKSVLNAFIHRGIDVLVTRGTGIRHHFNAPSRSGWTTLPLEPYHRSYEEEA